MNHYMKLTVLSAIFIIGASMGGVSATPQGYLGQISMTYPYFVDTADSPHEEDINLITERGITRGCNPPDNDKFCPERTITRAELAVFLARSLLLPTSERDHFVDDRGHLHEEDINRLAAKGIAHGCNPPDNTRYCPERVVTRGKIASLLVRAFSDSLGSQISHQEQEQFIDVIGHTHESAISQLAELRVTGGCNPPTFSRFCPDRAVTRGEVASLIVRATETDNQDLVPAPGDGIPSHPIPIDYIENRYCQVNPLPPGC